MSTPELLVAGYLALGLGVLAGMARVGSLDGLELARGPLHRACLEAVAMAVPFLWPGMIVLALALPRRKR